MIVVVDVPGNQYQLLRWLENFDHVELKTLDALTSLNDNDVVCIPGGNNFEAVSRCDAYIKHAIGVRQKLFCICGAFQFLFEKTDETKYLRGAGILSGEVEDLGFFNIGMDYVSSQKILPTEVYFNHRYGVSIQKIKKKSNADYLFISNGMLAGIKEEYLLGTQFHPELSLGNFDKEFKNWLDGR